MAESFGDAGDFGDPAEPGLICHDLAIWYEADGKELACPCCAAYQSEHAILCPVGRAVAWRHRNSTT